MPKRSLTGTLKKLPTVTLIMAIYPIIYLLQPGASLANQRSATGYPLPLLWFCKKPVLTPTPMSGFLAQFPSLQIHEHPLPNPCLFYTGPYV